MCPYSQSLELYHSGRRAELESNLNKAGKCYRLAVRLEPENPIYIQAMAKLAQRLDKHGDAERLYLEAIKCAKHVSGHSNALVTALVCRLRGF